MMKNFQAFSLIELLVVIGIIAILVALAVPAFNSIGKGREIEAATVQISDAIGLARQTAQSKNRPTEIRFFRHSGRLDTNQAFRSLQVFSLEDDGTETPLIRPIRLPDSLAVSDASEWSTLMQSGALEELATSDVPSIGPVSRALALRFRPNGRPSLANLNSNYFLTVLPLIPSQTNNFATIQIDPLTGRTRTFRP